MADKLIEIESENWPILRDLYDVNDANTYYGHCTIDNYIRWLEKEPHERDWNIYSLNGDWSDGTYLVVVSHFRYYYHLNQIMSLFCLFIFSFTINVAVGKFHFILVHCRWHKSYVHFLCAHSSWIISENNKLLNKKNVLLHTTESRICIRVIAG